MSDPTLRGVVRQLILPVFLPTFLYGAAVAALITVQVSTAVSLGASLTWAAGFTAWLSLCCIPGSIIAGAAVGKIGDGRALLISGSASIIAVIALICWLRLRLPLPLAAFAVALSIVEVADGVWSLARQSLLAEFAPSWCRARVVNTYGGIQRLSRVIGAALAGVLMKYRGVSSIFLLFVACSLVAMTVIVRYRLAPDVPASDPGETLPKVSWKHYLAPSGSIVRVGTITFVLVAVRAGRDQLFQMWPIAFFGQDAAQLTSLAFSISAGCELLLFFPAGDAMDRLGRAPVVTAQPAYCDH